MIPSHAWNSTTPAALWRNRQPESKHSPPFTRQPRVSSRAGADGVARAQGREKPP